MICVPTYVSRKVLEKRISALLFFEVSDPPLENRERLRLIGHCFAPPTPDVCLLNSARVYCAHVLALPLDRSRSTVKKQTEGMQKLQGCLACR